MKIFLRFALLVLFCGLGVVSHAQTLAELQQEWRATNSMQPPKRFDRLLPKLLAFRQQAGGQSWQLNYMLGSSYCQVPGDEEKGKIVLYRVLGSYGLPEAARAAAEKVISDCGAESQELEVLPTSVVTVSGQVGAVVHGKGGYDVRPDSPPTTGKLQISRVSNEDLKKRVFAPDRAREAEESALKLARQVDPSARSEVREGFVVTSVELPGSMTAECLSHYRQALQSQFNMRLPSALLTVYTVPRPEEVPRYAATLHGVHLPLGTIAYSVYEDLSLVGVAAAEACGSLAHELVHLSIRQNFDDSPAWLEEGLASEVAVANPSGNSFRFNKSWRDESLRTHWKLRPSVSELLTKTWADYATDDPSQVSRVAALHAMAACFIRYLDARHVLVPVYNSMRDSLSSKEPMSDADILKKELAMNLEKIDADFTQWFGYSPANSPKP
jgi:hypothetical protein